jgi:Bacterial Ig-like domain
MLNKKRSFWPLILPLFTLVFGCANRQPPEGGPRDHDPPKLLKANPPNMTRFFKGKTIKLDFDEYFKLTNAYSEISMSPTPAKIPEYKKVQKSIVITLRDSLEKNTTYVINFGKAIADVDEGNVLKNFTYVFSTGAHIDSLSISGRVTNTLTGERDKEAVVMLFTLKQDSLLFGKKKPTIYASVDTAGNFALNNLHPDDYRLYALKQTVANKIYDPNKDLIAFNTKTIHLTGDTSNVELKLFKETPTNFRLLSTKNFDADGKIRFNFNKPLEDPSIKIVYPPDFDKYKIVEFSKTKDTATVFLRSMDFDSIRMELFDKGKPIDTIALRKGKKEAFTRTQSFSYNLSQDAKLKPGRLLTVTAGYPIADLEPTAISLKEDSTDVSNFNVVRDTANPRKFIIDYRWKQKITYHLTIGADAVTDIYGGKNKGVRQPFQVDNPENYSLSTLTVTVPDTSKSYILELLNEKSQVLRSDIIRKNTSLVYKDYITAKYHVRVIYDNNKNGKWDSGNVKLRRQPENIWLDPEIIALRPNWEQTTPITVPKEPVTP